MFLLLLLLMMQLYNQQNSKSPLVSTPALSLESHHNFHLIEEVTTTHCQNLQVDVAAAAAAKTAVVALVNDTASRQTTIDC
jgi:hypothetical protein